MILIYPKYEKNHNLPMLAAYDYSAAQTDKTDGIEIILIDDSLLPLKAGIRATKTTYIMDDMPFVSYQTNKSTAIKNFITNVDQQSFPNKTNMPFLKNDINGSIIQHLS
tara:strand:+ start:227 stop:553 length:327 start_codon:yes stop_codon:yes gene_type:complete